MSFLRQRGITLLLLILVYVWFFIGRLPNLTQQKTNILSAQTNVSIFFQPTSGKTPIINEINNAQHELLVEVYLLSDKDVISSLCNARKRGLAIDVMLEHHPFGGGNLNNNSRQNLLDCNISVNWSNPNFSLTHEKTITIDSKEVFILNQNLTASSFSKNREFDVLDKNLNDVNEIRSIFVSDWQRKTYKPNSTHLLVSPDTSRNEIVKLIRSASTTIDIEAEDIDDIQIVSLLGQIAKTEKVRLITPTLNQISSNKNALNSLKTQGVEVRTLSSPYVHAKLILVDDKNAYIGSINLSSQSLDKNREVGIIISEQTGIQILQSVFETDWLKAKNL